MYNSKRRSKMNRNHIAKVLHEPERAAAELQFVRQHAEDSDEELFNYVKQEKRRLGGKMKPVNTVGYLYLQQRLGPWPVFMGRINRELEEEQNCPENIEKKPAENGEEKIEKSKEE